MSQSLANVVVHIVYSTKNREPWLKDPNLCNELFGIEYDDGTQRRVRATPAGFRSSSRLVSQGCAPLADSRRSTPGYVRAVPLGLAPVSLVRWRFMRLSTRRSKSQRSGEKRTLESWQALIDTKCRSFFMSVANIHNSQFKIQDQP